MTLALIRLARAKVASDDRDAALSTFRLAERVADTAKNEGQSRPSALMRTAVARGKIGDTDPARRLSPDSAARPPGSRSRRGTSDVHGH